MKEDKSYKIVLQGEIADGYDPEAVKDKLATVFNKSPKQIEKLLKKPTAIRENLTQEVALKYKQGLEKIGVLCYVEGDIEAVEKKETPLATKKVDSQSTKGLAFVIDGEGGRLSIVDIKMPFFSMVVFIIKWIFASIPAMMIAVIFIFIFNVLIAFMLPIVLTFLK